MISRWLNLHQQQRLAYQIVRMRLHMSNFALKAGSFKLPQTSQLTSPDLDWPMWELLVPICDSVPTVTMASQYHCGIGNWYSEQGVLRNQAYCCRLR